MLSNQLFLLFLIMGIGYAIGRIKIKGIRFGAAGILLTALIFGHFGYDVPQIIQNIGLACFVTAVGFIAGPGFLHNIKGKAKSFVLIGTGIIASGVITCLFIQWVTKTPMDLSLGLLAGALTTTPGLAAGIEATGSELVSVGYGIAYPFGVISVVLFVQAIPKLLHADLEKEREDLQKTSRWRQKMIADNLIRFDSYGLFSFSVAIGIGLLIAQVRIPLPGGGSFSLGTSGGPLLAGIILGHFQTVKIFDMRIKNSTLVTMRELGLAFFLVGAGTHAGAGFVQTVQEHGLILFVYGALMAIVPLIVGLLIARYVFKLNTLETLGSICGGMTSTPALGTLISTSGTDEVTNSYAATYPAALALIVVLMELIGSMIR